MTGSESWIDQPGGKELLAARISNPTYRTRARSDIELQRRKSEPVPGPETTVAEWDKIIDVRIKTKMGKSLLRQQQRSFAAFALAVNPQTFHASWPVDPSRRDRGQDPFVGGPAAKTLVIYQQPGFVTDEGDGRLNQFARASGYPRIHVVGFATEVIETLIMVFRISASYRPQEAKMLRWEKDGHLVEYNPIDR